MENVSIFWNVIIVVGVLANSFMIWRLRCVHVAHHQRTAVIDACLSHEDLADFYAAPSYEDHIKALIWRRDPWAMYGDLGNRARAIYEG